MQYEDDANTKFADREIHVPRTLARMKEIAGTPSDAALAKRLGVSKGTLSSWKTRNSIPLEALVRASRALDASLDEILGDIFVPSRKKYADALALQIMDMVEPEFKPEIFRDQVITKSLIFNLISSIVRDRVLVGQDETEVNIKVIFNKRCDELTKDKTAFFVKYISGPLGNRTIDQTVRFVPSG